MVKKMLILMLFSIGITALANCSKKEEPVSIDLQKREIISPVEKHLDKEPLRIAVGGMITPKEGFIYYRRFLDYIGEKLNRHVEFVDRESYAEVNNLVKKREVDVAFVCGGPYVVGHKEFRMELLAAPVAYSGTVYYSYIIAAKNSGINTFEELRNKKFAFTDPMSNTGKVVPTYMLARMNETPDSFFKSYIFAGSHDKSIQAVAQGNVDGAAVDSLIWEYANRVNPEFTSKTRIIKKSPPYGIPPVVVHPELDQKLKEVLREIFLNAHNDEKGKEILQNMMIDRFTLIDDSAYDSIREMKEWIAEKEKLK